MKQHQFARYGESNGRAKLTTEKVQALREAITSLKSAVYGEREEMRECNHFMSGPFCMLCGQPADEPCPSSCGVDMAAPGGDKTAMVACERGELVGIRYIETQAQEPAVSDAAWSMVERDYGSRSEQEEFLHDRELVLRTREEWEQRGQDSAALAGRVGENILLGQIEFLRAELARVTRERDEARAEAHKLVGDYEAELMALRAEIDRLRKGVMQDGARVSGANELAGPAHPQKHAALLTRAPELEHRMGRAAMEG